MLGESSPPNGSKAKSVSLATDRRLTLAAHVAELEAIIAEMPEDGEVPSEVLTRFEGAQLELAQKVDRYIALLEAGKFLAEALKEREQRMRQARKGAERLTEKLKEMAKFVMESTGRRALPGAELGTLALHKNPESVHVDFDVQDKTVYRCLDAALLTMEPSLLTYVKTFMFHSIDLEKLKADLKSGMEVPWARLASGSHVRIRG